MMEVANRLQQCLKKGRPAFGGWQMLAGTNLARVVARTGIDWICVDAEHGNISDDSVTEAVNAIADASVSPIVRIPASEPWMVKRALDCGAHGIMVPLLENALQAKKLVSAAKFPPRGTRGFGSPFPMGAFTSSTGATPNAVEYLHQANDAILTVIQIETQQALDNVDEIAAVDGVDILFVGPFDLGNNIGRPLIGEMHEDLKNAVTKIREAAKRAGKWSGIYCTDGNQARKYADEGFQMMNVTGDVAALQRDFANQLGAAKGSLAHSAYQTAKGVASKVTGPYEG